MNLQKMRFRITNTGLLRAGIDAALINLSLVVALVLRLLFLFRFEQEAMATLGPSATINRFVGFYASYGPAITVICLLTFYLSGFYTFGRAYMGKYKALVVIQATSVAYLLFSFGMYFAYPAWPLPRMVLLMSWGLTTGLLLTARFMSRLWTGVVREESRLKAQGKIDGRAERVLVIGGAGYIGSIAVRKLLKRGYKVRVLDSLVYGDRPIADLLERPDFELVIGDLRNIEAIVSSIQGMDAIIHLGAIVGDPACALDEQLTMEINLLATQMIAQVAKGYGIQRFVFASTCSVYGASDELLDEKSQLNPVSLYARSKIESEKALLQMAREDFSPVILRLATIYGLSPRPRFDLVVNLLAAKAVIDGEITIFGGEQWRPFVHVDDAAEAFITCLEAPISSVRGETFNVGDNDQNYRIIEIGEMIQRLVPRAKLTTGGTDTDRRNYHVRFDKIRNRLNFRPRFGVEMGIREIQEAIARGEITDYRDPFYSNYSYLSLNIDDLEVMRHYTPSNLLTMAANGTRVGE